MVNNGYEEAETTSDHCASCNCFGFSSCFGRRSHGNESKRLLEQKGDNSWWAEKLNKTKEFSEVWLGPKWKNLIRKISYWKKQRRQDDRLRYDSFTYALNFDQQGGDADGLPWTFSTRFSSPDGPRTPAASEMAAVSS